MARMALDPETSCRMGQRGKDLVEQGFTVEAAVAGIRAGVMRVVGRTPAAKER
jgi:hypothetical protein